MTDRVVARGSPTHAPREQPLGSGAPAPRCPTVSTCEPSSVHSSPRWHCLRWPSRATPFLACAPRSSASSKRSRHPSVRHGTPTRRGWTSPTVATTGTARGWPPGYSPTRSGCGAGDGASGWDPPSAGEGYHGAFMALPSDSRSSWRRVTRLTDAEPGDVIAWVFPPWVRASITGHVAILVARPVPVPGVASRYRVRVADSTTVPHAADTRPRTAASALGTATSRSPWTRTRARRSHTGGMTGRDGDFCERRSRSRGHRRGARLPPPASAARIARRADHRDGWRLFRKWGTTRGQWLRFHGDGRRRRGGRAVARTARRVPVAKVAL